MSYVTKRGQAAQESAMQEKQDYSKVMAKFSDGSSYKVRIISVNDNVEYMAASVYKVFNTTPVMPENLYEKASKLLYKDAEGLEGDEQKAVSDKAYSLLPKPRYLFGFINLETGEPIVIDTSKNQSKIFFAAINKYAKKIDKLAFEISKTGSGKNTVVAMSPIIDMDEDLTDKERENFAKSAGKTITDEMFENCLYVKDTAEQIEDLTKFDASLLARLGVTAGATETTETGAPGKAEDYDF